MVDFQLLLWKVDSSWALGREEPFIGKLYEPFLPPTAAMCLT